MTREEAIKILDPKTCRDALMEYMGGTWHQAQALALINEAQKMGLSALRAQRTNAELDRSRWKGCVVCNKCGVSGSNELFCNGAEAQYCPFCGRPLTEEAWAELERRISQ